MTDKKISALPTASALTGVELTPVVQFGTTKKATTQQIADLVKVVFAPDTGSGGTIGMVPPPTAGDVTAGRLLAANGAWTDPPSIATARRYFTTIGYGIATTLIKRQTSVRLFPTVQIP